MIKAALEAESLASKVESMTNRISTALNVLKDKDIGDIVSVEDYDKLINEYPHLANNFIRTIEGY
jgi:hypothetical protein